VVSLPAELVNTIEVASSSAILALQDSQIVVSEKDTLENMGLCTDVCIHVRHNHLTYPNLESVNVRLLSPEALHVRGETSMTG